MQTHVQFLFALETPAANYFYIFIKCNFNNNKNTHIKLRTLNGNSAGMDE
jgi:hypothetical protein